MKNRAAFAAGAICAAALLASFSSPSCSHQRVAVDAQASPARFLPHPAFAYAGADQRLAAASIADIAEKSLPAVVNISSTKVVRQEQGDAHTPFFNDPFFRRFFGDRFGPFEGPQREHRERSLGSGVIVGRDGTVLTNNHVVEHAQQIKVTLADKRELDAKIVGTDPKSDLAVLKLQGDLSALQPLPLGDSNRLRLGDVVLAIGNPFAVGQTVTMGIVSAKGRADVGIVDYEDFIQTDAAINPGNSGGALINMAGELVGINTAILSRSGGYQGIGFAIPSNMARPIMDSLTKHGKVVRGWLGVAIQDLNRELAKALELKETRGVLIADVTPGSPADKAGLQRGDVVLAIGGEPVATSGRLRNLVATAGKGARIKIELARRGQRKTVEVQLGEMDVRPSGRAELEREEGGLGGLTVSGLTDALRAKHNIPARVKQGVVVTAIEPGSPAQQAGLTVGDVILELNRRPIAHAGELRELYQQARGQLLLLVYREGNTLFLLLSK